VRYSLGHAIPKMRPRTRHINQNYHHFREWVKSGLIVDTLNQPADLLKKPLYLSFFVKFRKAIMELTGECKAPGLPGRFAMHARIISACPLGLPGSEK
jgi:hypothetical protein